MRALPELKDRFYVEPKPTALNNWFISLLHDKRDLPFIYLTLKISLIMIPFGLALYIPMPAYIFWPAAVVYFYISNFVFKGPFGLMLHCTSHRTFFKPKYQILNHYLPWIVGPFFGQTPNTYYSHHIWMHHPENNLPEDESTTMPYQRNKLSHFFMYFFDFLAIGMVRLIGYFKRKNRKNLIINSLAGELLYIALCIGLSFVNWQATLFVFILPIIVSRFIMMLGNWTQHAFVDPQDPGNAYKNSITCINVKYNHLCWNDGYHISHHIRPGMHWTKHPEYFLECLDEYKQNKAIVFDGIDFLQVFIALMGGNYKKLAAHVVNFDNNTFQSEEELIEHMKYRCQAIRA